MWYNTEVKRVIKWSAIILFFVGSCFAANVVGHTKGLSTNPNSKFFNEDNVHLNKDVLWSEIQAWRKEDGLKPYIEDKRLCEIAERRAPQLKSEDEAGTPHAGFKESLGNLSELKIAENNTGARHEREALENWLRSASHAATLREDYKYSCVATDDKMHAVQIFSNF